MRGAAAAYCATAVDVRDGDALAVRETLAAVLDQAVGWVQTVHDFNELAVRSTQLDCFLARGLGGNVGDPGKVRVPQVRYTIGVPFGGSFSVSAETPETEEG